MSVGATRTSTLAICSLVFSCLSITLGPLGCIPGIILGIIALVQMSRDPGLLGKGMAIGGIVVGAVFLLLFIALVIFLYFTSSTTATPFIYTTF